MREHTNSTRGSHGEATKATGKALRPAAAIIDNGRMPGKERMLVYAVAIQTGLRAGELASLTRGRLFLGHNPPFVTCKAGNTKNKQDARLYLQRDSADRLVAHIATKVPGAAVFAMPHVANVAQMFTADPQDARRAWLDAAHGPDERLRREQSDFLAAKNHEGEVADFHCPFWQTRTPRTAWQWRRKRLPWFQPNESSGPSCSCEGRR
jgi:hypothetical protein